MRQKFELACRRENLWTSAKAAMFVGAVLDAIQLVDLLPLWVKLIVTPIVPFCVCLYGRLSSRSTLSKLKVHEKDMRVSAMTGVIVGAILDGIQLVVMPTWVRLTITPVVPFCVCMSGCVSSQLAQCRKEIL